MSRESAKDQESSGYQTDHQLWSAVLAGDSRAFEEVVKKYQSAVAAVAYSITGDFGRSEDVAQESFWQAYRSRHQLNDPQRLGGWLCGIARNLAHNVNRKNFRSNSTVELDHPIVDQDSTDPLRDSITTEESDLVWNALAEIPETYREALVLFYRHGASVAEVARILDISTDAAKQRLSRGREFLRTQLTLTIEGVLMRTRPAALFTAKVMAGIAALTASLKATGVAVAATTAAKASAAATTSSGATSTAGAGLLASASMGGLLGGLLGVLGGLGGAFLGSWLPAQMATSQDEHELLRSHGRATFRGAVWMTLAILLTLPLAFLWRNQIPFVTAVGLISLVFAAWCIVQHLNVHKQLAALRQNPDRQKVPIKTAVNSWFIDSQGQSIWVGRKFRSSWKLLGVPLLDIQFRDPIPQSESNSGTGKAWGWIAMGDDATGILLAYGGIARGLIALGGIAVGGVACGGLALGGLAFGGGAFGWLAIAGVAIGFDAAGGVAAGWHSAAGGAAVAHHIALGGGAWAQDFAVGGSAYASEINTPAAREIVEQKSLKWLMDILVNNMALGIAAIVAISLLPLLLTPLTYLRRADNSRA